MPPQRVGNGLEVGLREHLLEILVIPFDFRVFGARQRRLEARVFHQFPGLQVDAPGLGQAFLVAVLVAQLLEECALGRHVGGQAQGAVGQAIARLGVVARRRPGQFVVGEVANQPGVVTVVAGSDGHGALGGHGKARVERVRHAAPPVHARADAGIVADDRQRQGVGHALGLGQRRVAPVAQGVEAPGLQAIEGVGLPAAAV